MHQQVNDADIIKAVLQGRKQNFALLVARYQHFVFTIALRYVPNREDAEELAQDIFIKAYKSLADYRAESKFSTWLYTITHRTCISFLRKKKSITTPVENEKLSAIAENISAINDTEHINKHKAHKQVLNIAIGLLPEDDAEVITLFYLAEQSLEEIGMILGITANNAKTKLYRARQKMRTILERTYGREISLLYND